MTVIGALSCADGIVLCADRQETIADYAKWDVEKIKYFEASGGYRLLMAGSGDADMIEATWEEILSVIFKERTRADNLKNVVVDNVRRLARLCIFPCPRDDRPITTLIWAIQHLADTTLAPWERIELFRTNRLAVNSISRPYFTGSPLLITRYLSDAFLRGLIYNLEEAEALACYFLWEAKEYDPNCGKNSDVIVIRRDGTVRRLLGKEIEYWEEHFAYLKGCMRMLPLLSCAGSLTQRVQKPVDQLRRFLTAFRTLMREQAQMRRQIRPEQTRLERVLMNNLSKAEARREKRADAKAGQALDRLVESVKPSNSQK